MKLPLILSISIFMIIYIHMYKILRNTILSYNYSVLKKDEGQFCPLFKTNEGILLHR